MKTRGYISGALLMLCLVGCSRADEADDPEGLLDPVQEGTIREPEYSVFVGRWSECIPTDRREHLTRANRSGLGLESLVHTPRLGLQRRQLQCRRKDGRFVDLSLCGALIARAGVLRVCVVREPCALAEWLPWRPRPDGALVRTRRVRRLPQGGGTECGVVEEVRPAAPEPDAHWAPAAWGRCHVASDAASAISSDAPAHLESSNPTTDIYEDDEPPFADDGDDDSKPRCGGGVQRREASCVRTDGRVLHPVHCAHAPMPTLVQPCEVACPRDCEVSEWGEWNACQPTEGCPLYPVQQLTTTGFSVRRRRVTAASAGGGTHCPPLEEKRSCSTPRCAAWRALSWGPCVLSEPHTTCGPGRRTRELRCVGHDGKEAERAWCSASGAPARSERCRIACAGDCVVSAWGAWSACSASCAGHGRTTPTRYRRRHILAHAAPDGWPCPPDELLMQREACNTHACNTYSWFSAPWSACERRPAEDQPGTNFTDILDDNSLEDEEEELCREEGEMTKTVMCVQNQADIVRESLIRCSCAPLRRPTSRRACSLRCKRACRVEAWSPWSPCPDTCHASKQVRVRRVHGGRDCKEARHETRDCPMPRSCRIGNANWVTGAWTACRLPPGQRCGTGYRARSIWCGTDSHRIETGTCAGQPMPHSVAPCHMPCSRVPPLTCDLVCADPLRYLDTSELTPDNCVCKNINLELLPSDSDCILPQGSECGIGRMLRAARCVANGRDVPMDVCRKYIPLPGPKNVRTGSLTYDEEFPGLLSGECTVGCARDCATDAWGEWGPCAAEAGSLAAFRFRTREVIEEGSSGGRECGATLQRATCELSSPRWQTEDWGVCAPQRMLCGRAIINRTVTCVGARGTPLDDSACAAAGPAPTREAACRAPCPSDCVVSAWSDWSPCEQTKWGGRRDRTRVMLRGAGDGGAECPQLVEAEPCAPHAHSWHLAPWDDCQPLGGSPCGEGIKKRAVRCLRSDGVFVNDSFCPNTTATEARESWCYVPCGVDCASAEWSSWDASACSCGDVSSVRHMRRVRQRLVAAVWPGRACGALEQRAPCPRTPCMRLVATPLLGCHVQTANGSDTDGACGWGARVTVARCELLTMDDEKVAGAALEPWRCAPALPGRIVSPPLYYQEESCSVECGCGAGSVVAAGTWGAWGPCRGGARSRTRQLLLPPRAACRDVARYVTIEWANCTEGDEFPDLLALDDGIGEVKQRPWVEHGTYHDGYLEGSSSVLAIVWTSTIVLSLYGTFMLYRGLVRCLRSRRLKSITKV